MAKGSVETSYEKHTIELEAKKGTPAYLIGKWLNINKYTVLEYINKLGIDYKPRICWIDNNDKSKRGGEIWDG